MRPLSLLQLRELCTTFMPDTNVSDEMLKLANGSFGKIANLKKSGGDEIYEELISCLKNPRSNSIDMMTIAKKLAPDPALHGILLDAIAAFNLADLYPSATHAIADITRINLEPEIGLFKIITQIKKCL